MGGEKASGAKLYQKQRKMREWPKKLNCKIMRPYNYIPKGLIDTQKEW
jgi:hypothetical protein